MSIGDADPRAYAAYCQDLRMEAPTIAELAHATFDVAWAGVRSRGTPLFQVCTEAGERNMTDGEDQAFKRELQAWVSRRFGYTERYDSSSRPEGAGGDS